MMASTTRDETKNMHVTVCMLAILHVLLSSSYFFQYNLSGTLSECQTAGVQISVAILGTKCLQR